MTRSTHATLLIVLFLSGSAIQTQGFSYYRRCVGVHTEYRTCGSACPTTCKDLVYPQTSRVCTSQCVAGFFCKEGYYRTDDGRCVQRPECCQ
ncbi:unnamed protein product, partial [Rotaria sp. Silwood2]